MNEKITNKVVAWIQAMAKGEKIVIEDEGYVHYFRQHGKQIKMHYADGAWKSESSMTLNDMLYFAQEQLEKEEKDAKTRQRIAH